MKTSEVVGYAVFSVALGLLGVALSEFPMATRTGNDVIPWVCFMTAFAGLTLGMVGCTAGVSIASLSANRAVGLWMALSALFGPGLYLDWYLYFHAAEPLNGVLFELLGIVPIYATLLLLPRLLRSPETGE